MGLQPSLDGYRCLVTGAAGSMGRAITRALVESGARVVATDVVAARLDELADELAPLGAPSW